MECLFDDTVPNGTHLILQHPLTRYIHSSYSEHLPLSGAFFNNFWEKKEPLRVLLVEANTYPSLPGVHEEVESVAKILKSGLAQKGIDCKISHLRSNEATGGNFASILKTHQHHLVHFAGHAHFDNSSPEQSFLVLWEDIEHKSLRHLRVPELSALLSNSLVRFIYLSCCESSASDSSNALLDDDFLGIVDGVICSGVSSVLGFRWPVSDKGAQQFARQFYTALIEQGELPVAIFRARQFLAAQDRDDITWLSPILVVQE